MVQGVKHCNQLAKALRRLGAQPPSTRFGGAAPKVQTAWGAQLSGMQTGLRDCSPSRKSMFNLGVARRRSNHKRPYGTIEKRRLTQLPELNTLISLGACISPDLVVSTLPAPQRLRSSNTLYLAGCAPATMRVEASLPKLCSGLAT